jgi:hypothetical protein
LFETVRRIEDAYYKNEFQIFIVYGPFGYGKSSYAIQVLNEIYHWWTYNKDGTVTYSRDDWFEDFQRHIFFHPKDFILRCVREDNRREKAVVWDDAGLWLHALDFSDPFVKAVGKYLNVARTDFAAIIFTAPLPTWVTYKVRNLPQAITLKIIKLSSNPSIKDMRRAKAFQFWISPDMKKSGVRNIYHDDFKVKLPQDAYDKYMPERQKYSKMASKGMLEELLKIDSELIKKENELKLTV